MFAEIFISVVLVFLVVIIFGFLYLWLLWLLADITNP